MIPECVHIDACFFSWLSIRRFLLISSISHFTPVTSTRSCGSNLLCSVCFASGDVFGVFPFVMNSIEFQHKQENQGKWAVGARFKVQGQDQYSVQRQEKLNPIYSPTQPNSCKSTQLRQLVGANPWICILKPIYAVHGQLRVWSRKTTKGSLFSTRAQEDPDGLRKNWSWG